MPSAMKKCFDGLKRIKKQKIFIAARQDGLLSVPDLEMDAHRGGFQFLTVDNASHFLTFDQPEQVARLIEECITAVGERSYLWLVRNPSITETYPF
jgi:pimeloyl-ACP methyl ester carboxylesterase